MSMTEFSIEIFRKWPRNGVLDWTPKIWNPDKFEVFPPLKEMQESLIDKENLQKLIVGFFPSTKIHFSIFS